MLMLTLKQKVKMGMMKKKPEKTLVMKLIVNNQKEKRTKKQHQSKILLQIQ